MRPRIQNPYAAKKRRRRRKKKNETVMLRVSDAIVHISCGMSTAGSSSFSVFS
jgi:hypothetical protein